MKKRGALHGANTILVTLQTDKVLTVLHILTILLNIKISAKYGLTEEVCRKQHLILTDIVHSTTFSVDIHSFLFLIRN